MSELGSPDGAIAVSFEFFPPKTAEMDAKLWDTVCALAPIGPAFVSVTYGAGGSTRARTHATVARIVREAGLVAAAHLTCVQATRAEIDDVARAYWDAGVRHIVALRGDPPEGSDGYTPHPDGYAYAADRVRAAQAATVEPGATAEDRRAAGERLHEETLAHNDLRPEHARARDSRRAEIAAQRRRADAATEDFVDSAQERYFMEEGAHYAAYRSEREREVRRAHGKPPGGSRPGDGGQNDPPERTLFNVCGGSVRECFTPAHVIDNPGLSPFER
jgi:hypothetical protein